MCSIPGLSIFTCWVGRRENKQPCVAFSLSFSLPPPVTLLALSPLSLCRSRCSIAHSENTVFESLTRGQQCNQAWGRANLRSFCSVVAYLCCFIAPLRAECLFPFCGQQFSLHSHIGAERNLGIASRIQHKVSVFTTKKLHAPCCILSELSLPHSTVSNCAAALSYVLHIQSRARK